MNPFLERREFLAKLKTLKKEKPETIPTNTPNDLFVQCPTCQKAVTQKALSQNMRVCPNCNHHFSVSAYHRLKMLLDSKSFSELDANLQSFNPLDFPQYEQKLAQLKQNTALNDSVVTAKGKISGHRVVVCVMDSRFLMGSMGSVCGEKIARATEYATSKKLPLIIFCASGGARMQEGILSLFQMAKTSAAIEKHRNAGLLYISVLTHPTTGGVTASFASLGDIIIAEPNALIGFAGPRVIEQTIKQKLPDGFQRSEYLLKHGFVDLISQRQDLKNKLTFLLDIHKRSSL